MAELDKLSNIGVFGQNYQFGKVRRLAFQLKYKEDGTRNKLTGSSGQITLATLQTLVNKHSYDSDVKEKLVITPFVYQYKPTPEDPTIYDNNDNFRLKTKEGDLTATFIMEMPHPGIVRQLKEYENYQIGMYQIDDDSRIGGYVDDTYIYPIECSLEVKPWKQFDYEDPTKLMCTIRFYNPLDINHFDFAQIVDADGDDANINDNTQFYSLTDCKLTVTTPAVTGCIVKVENKRLSTVGNSVGITGLTYTDFQFRNQTTLATTALAGAGSITESTSVEGQYTINESALLTAGVSYWIEIIADKYDAVRAAVVVPS